MHCEVLHGINFPIALIALTTLCSVQQSLSQHCFFQSSTYVDHYSLSSSDDANERLIFRHFRLLYKASRKRVRRRYLLSPLPIRDFLTDHLIFYIYHDNFTFVLNFFCFFFHTDDDLLNHFSSNASIVYSIFRYALAFSRVKRL